MYCPAVFFRQLKGCKWDVSHYLIKLIPCSAFGMQGVVPRIARLDAPGILHHVIIRGIERKKIFSDTIDKQNLVDRLDQLIPQTQASCYAWVLLSNHAHFFIVGNKRDVSHYLIKLILCSAFGMQGVMLRLVRLDAPGILHHVIIRGIERKKIFRDTIDKQNLVDRLDQLIPQTQTSCYAWVLLSNHAHFLLWENGGP